MTAVVVVMGCGLVASAGEWVEAARWYPPAAGRAWTYQVGESRMTVRVVGPAEGGVKLETAVNGQVVASEVLQVRPDGVYRTHINGQAVTPPVRTLALERGAPPAAAAWDIDSQVGGQPMTGRFALDREKVSVPAGEYEAVVVRGTNFSIAGTPTAVTYWFARDVGIVRLAYTIGGTEAVLELVEAAK